MGKKLLFLVVVLAGSGLIFCLPPPPELQEMKARRQLAEGNKDLVLPRIHTIYMGPLQYNDEYMVHLIMRGLLCYGINTTEGEVFEFVQKKMVDGINQIDQLTMLSAFTKFGFSVYQLEGAQLEDLAVLLYENMPVLMHTKTYCLIGLDGDGFAATDDPKDYLKMMDREIYGRYTMLVGFDGYNPQSPDTGYMQYFGYKLQKIPFTKFREKEKTYFVPVKSDSALAAIQEKLEQYHAFHKLAHPVPRFKKIL